MKKVSELQELEKFLLIPNMKESIQEGMRENIDDCADNIDL